MCMVKCEGAGDSHGDGGVMAGVMVMMGQGVNM